MPLISRRGGISARGFGFGGNVRSARFVASLLFNADSSGNGPITWPVGVTTGDVALITTWEGFGDGAVMTGGAGGWTKDAIHWTSYGYFSATFTKQLVLADLSGVSVSGTYGGGAILALVYRRCSSATLKSTNASASGSTLPLPGFTKSANSMGIVTFAQDRDGPPTSPTAPTNFAMRAGPGTGAFVTVNGADLLTLGLYTNGATVTWTNFAPTLDQIGFLYELT